MSELLCENICQSINKMSENMPVDVRQVGSGARLEHPKVDRLEHREVDRLEHRKVDRLERRKVT